MMVEVNSDNHITTSQDLNSYITSTISDSLSRFSEQVTRILVHLGDENGQKTGKDDKRCLIEARLGGMAQVAVTAYADRVDQAIHDAIHKLIAALEKAIGHLKR